MPALVLDANAALHAKQLPGEGLCPMALLERLATEGARFLTTGPVEAEQVKMTLSERHADWRQKGWFSSESTSTRERREIRNEHRGQNAWPGDNDIGLIALARREDAVLLSHDWAATKLSRTCKVITVDLLDLAALAVHRGWVSWPEVETGFVGLRKFAWQPDDWAGSVQGAVASRPSGERLLTRLSAWLDSA